MHTNQKAQHWKQVFEQQKQSGLAIAMFCKQHQINVSTFYAWKKRLTQSDTGAELKHKHQLIPLFVNEQTASSSNLTIKLPNGFELTFNEYVSPERLAAFIKVLQ